MANPGEQVTDVALTEDRLIVDLADGDVDGGGSALGIGVGEAVVAVEVGIRGVGDSAVEVDGDGAVGAIGDRSEQHTT